MLTENECEVGASLLKCMWYPNIIKKERKGYSYITILRLKILFVNWTFFLWSQSYIVSINILDTGQYQSVWCHMTLDANINNNVSFEGLEIHYYQYHRSFYRTLCYARDNVYLDLHNCCCSIYTKNYTEPERDIATF